jgi:hypothetical protein
MIHKLNVKLANARLPVWKLFVRLSIVGILPEPIGSEGFEVEAGKATAQAPSDPSP